MPRRGRLKHVGALASSWWNSSEWLTSARGSTAGSPITRPATPSACRGGGCPAPAAAGGEGLELVALATPDECCGFGGTFAIRNADVSTAMLSDKLADIEQSGATAVCACDASCLMQIRGGLERSGSAVRALHLAEVLAG